MDSTIGEKNWEKFGRRQESRGTRARQVMFDWVEHFQGLRFDHLFWNFSPMGTTLIGV